MNVNWTAVATGVGLGIAFHYMNKSRRNKSTKPKEWTEAEKEEIKKIISEPPTARSSSNHSNDPSEQQIRAFNEDG